MAWGIEDHTYTLHLLALFDDSDVTCDTARREVWQQMHANLLWTGCFLIKETHMHAFLEKLKEASPIAPPPKKKKTKHQANN